LLTSLDKKDDKKTNATSSDGAEEKKVACDKFAAQAFKPLFCATCFCAKADHSASGSIFIIRVSWKV
jgi:hypothetical protein